MTSLPAAFVLGSDINALGVVRSLGRNGVPVHLFTSSPDDLSALSRFVARVERIDSATPDVTAALVQERARQLARRPALLFTTDGTLRLVSKHEAALRAVCDLQVPPAWAVATVVDKAEFGRWTQAEGFPVPRTFSPATREALREVAATARFPVVVKPTVSSRWAGKSFRMCRADDPAALTELWERLDGATGDLLVQEYVDAPDDQHFAYYSYRAPGQGERAHLTVQKLRVFPIHGGAGAFLRVVREPEMEATGRAILQRLDYAGIASVCFKRCATTGQPFIYEINGRMPQCHTAFRIAGVDLPYLLYRDVIGDPIPAPPQRDASGCWTSLSLDVSAFLAYRARGELGLLPWLASYAGVRTCAEFAWDDPLPFAALLGRIARHAVLGPPKAKRAPGVTTPAAAEPGTRPAA